MENQVSPEKSWKLNTMILESIGIYLWFTFQMYKVFMLVGAVA